MSYKLFERISFCLLLVFALIWVIFLSTALHEVSHYKDFHPYVKEDYICAFVWPESFSYFKDIDFKLGYYTYDYNRSNITTIEDIKKIEKHTEIRAYVISIIFLIIFFIVLSFQIIERKSNKRKTKLLNDLEKDIKQKHLNSLNNLNN